MADCIAGVRARSRGYTSLAHDAFRYNTKAYGLFKRMQAYSSLTKKWETMDGDNQDEVHLFLSKGKNCRYRSSPAPILDEMTSNPDLEGLESLASDDQKQKETAYACRA